MVVTNLSDLTAMRLAQALVIGTLKRIVVGLDLCQAKTSLVTVEWG